MYKAILAAFVAIGLLSVPAAAKPTSTEQTMVQQVVKKKKTVKKKRAKVVKAAKVAPEHNPFLKNQSVFDNSMDQSSASYWAQERARQEAVVAQVVKPPITRDQKRREIAKSCFLFFCVENEVTKTVVAEAKKWEGKNAKKDKKELKGLFASTGQEPIDPAHIPWCAAFANAILRRTEVEGTDSLMARSFLTWGAKTVDPKEGDVVVLKRGRSQWAGHVGFFIGYEWIDGVKYVKVLGGNQNKEVNVAYFPASHVIGYRTVA